MTRGHFFFFFFLKFFNINKIDVIFKIIIKSKLIFKFWSNDNFKIFNFKRTERNPNLPFNIGRNVKLIHVISLIYKSLYVA